MFDRPSTVAANPLVGQTDRLGLTASPEPDVLDRYSTNTDDRGFSVLPGGVLLTEHLSVAA
jgi:hypothetical protein